MSASRLWIIILALLSATVSVAADPSPTPVKSTDSASKSPLDGLKYRLVGPFRGGRATGVAGVVSEPNTYYFGASTGGLWKSIDAGTSWQPLWDDFPEAAAAVGAGGAAARGAQRGRPALPRLPRPPPHRSVLGGVLGGVGVRHPRGSRPVPIDR